MTAGNGPPPLGIVNSPGRVAGDALRVGTWTRVVDTPAPAAPTKIATTRTGSKMDLQSLSEMRDDAPSGVVLFNNLVRPQQQRRRDGEAKGLRGFQIDDQLELGRLLDREVGGFRALEDLVDVRCRASPQLVGVGAVRHEATSLYVFARPVDAGQPVF